MKKIFLFIFAAFMNLLNLSAEDTLGAFMVYGEDHTVSVMLPKTWMVDMESAQKIGVNAFFYLKKFNINTSPAGIILTLTDKPKEDSKLEEWVDYDTKNFVEKFKDYNAEKVDWNIKNENNYKIIVYKFSSKSSDIIQYSAYIDAGLKYFANIYIQAGSKDIGKYLEDFKSSLAKSHLSGIGFKMKTN